MRHIVSTCPSVSVCYIHLVTVASEWGSAHYPSHRIDVNSENYSIFWAYGEKRKQGGQLLRSETAHEKINY